MIEIKKKVKFYLINENELIKFKNRNKLDFYVPNEFNRIDFISSSISISLKSSVLVNRTVKIWI